MIMSLVSPVEHTNEKLVQNMPLYCASAIFFLLFNY